MRCKWNGILDVDSGATSKNDDVLIEHGGLQDPSFMLMGWVGGGLQYFSVRPRVFEFIETWLGLGLGGLGPVLDN